MSEDNEGFGSTLEKRQVTVVACAAWLERDAVAKTECGRLTADREERMGSSGDRGSKEEAVRICAVKTRPEDVSNT